MNILDLFFPKRCVGCGKIGTYFCAQCTSIIQIIEVQESICPVCERSAIDGRTHPRCQTRYGIDGLTSFFHYIGPIRNAIKLLKYSSVSDLAKEFVDLAPSLHFHEITKLRNNGTTLLVPIPLHPSRLRERGFNQAEVLGRLVADRLKILMRRDILVRLKKTTPQVEVKDREHRLKNMDGMFGINKLTIRHINNTTVFLFDDVFTTGATMRAAASVLKKAGAAKVWGITMAR